MPPGLSVRFCQVVQSGLTRKLVPRVGRETIRVLLLSHDLKPWRKKMWVVADLDEDYITKMEDVLEVYERPYDSQEPVVCLDEKPVTLHADVRPASPAKPGRETRLGNQYERCGTANVFCAVEPKAGRHFTFATPDRSGFEFAQVAVNLALAYPAAKTIHLVMDNLNIHSRKSLAHVFGAEMAAEVWSRFTVHYTPSHGSWLNQAEIEIGIFSRQCLGKRRIPNLENLRREAKAWNRRMNRNGVKINWKFDRKTARRKFGYKRNSFKRSET
jgi:DDE superfamily endonuclease